MKKNLTERELIIAASKYYEEYKEFPTWIIAVAVPFPMDITFDLKLTILSDLPEDFWMVYGKKGIIYSPGA